jgi:hypothetical protein
MPEKRDPFGPLRPWVAPALGVGLVVAGIAMIAGMPSVDAPFVGALVAALVLLVAKLWTARSTRP